MEHEAVFKPKHTAEQLIASHLDKIAAEAAQARTIEEAKTHVTGISNILEGETLAAVNPIDDVSENSI